MAFSLETVLFVNIDVLNSNLVVCLEVFNVFCLVLAVLQFEEEGWQLVDHNVNHESKKYFLEVRHIFWKCSKVEDQDRLYNYSNRELHQKQNTSYKSA